MCMWQGYSCMLFKLLTNSLGKNICDTFINFIKGTVLGGILIFKESGCRNDWLKEALK